MARDPRLAKDFGFRGFGGIGFPQDLLAKLRHDHQRILANPNAAYAAFDFFITADALPDWVWPSDRRAQRGLRETESIPRVCKHLADAAKHFFLVVPHSGVQELGVHVEIDSKGLQAQPESEGWQFVRLDAEDAVALRRAPFTIPA